MIAEGAGCRVSGVGCRLWGVGYEVSGVGKICFQLQLTPMLTCCFRCDILWYA
ncbi:hypothetical protein [Coleofasciculus sp. E2-BRE-01]|uniref:hypothetical protein n=1 Tax=Coleofasciculus sp. E2-BRE-01 TaxID=3069524 RepID=UPI0033055A3A